MFSCASAPVSYNQSPDLPAVLRRRNVTSESLASLSSNGYNKFIEKLNQMGSRNIYSKIPTSIDQLLKLPVPSELSQLLATLTAEGIAQDVLIHSFYSVLIEHSGRSSLKEKLLDKINAFINEDLIDIEVCERLCDTLDALFDARTPGVDRYEIPAFLRRSTD